MDTLQRTDLERLARVAEGPCVTIYLPTHVRGPAAEQDAIRLKNALRSVESQLADHWMRAADARAMLAAAAELPNDPMWWQQRGQGLAIFIGKQLFESYRLPISLPELATVDRRFRIRPLIPLLQVHQPFCILQLSQNQVELYSADEQSIEKVDAQLPEGLREALNYDGADRGTQVHSSAKVASRKKAAVFHGQGGQPDSTKDDLLNFCRVVDKAVTAALATTGRPLLLACVDYLSPIYRRANTYDQLLEETLSGNQDHESIKALHQRAVQLLRPEAAHPARAKAVERYRHVAGTKKVSEDICEVVMAAIQGRIDVMLCDPRALVLGVRHPDTGEVRVTGNEDDEDLIDLAAVETLKHRGEVYSMADLGLPTKSQVAAILRY